MALVRGTTTEDRRIPGASSYTISHNHNAGADGYLFVVITCPATTVSSVTYAGGGGGGGNQNPSYRTSDSSGGAGGGGAGSGGTTPHPIYGFGGVPGQVNTGGGGGGSSFPMPTTSGGSGGSGIVIIAYPT